jgi:hypothetical protein
MESPPNSITLLASLPNVTKRAIEVARKPIAKIPRRSKVATSPLRLK